MGIILVLILLLVLVSLLPTWPYSKDWDYTPSAVAVFFLTSVTVLIVENVIPMGV